MKNQSKTIFVYGTLSFDKVISGLLGRELAGSSATIAGFKRIKIKDKRYPGLIKSTPDSIIEGKVHTDIAAEELVLLDTFEDNFYQKIEAEVKLKDGQTKKAFTYIVPEHNKHFATKAEWNHDEFSEKHLQDYIEMVKKFRRYYLAGHRNNQEF